jgi:uncharacterized phiE125 gp8 family phage protein
MALKLTTAPAEEPITRANAKVKLGIASADTASDTQLDWMIPAARRWVEQRTGRALITQTWQLYLDSFSNVISLPLGKVQSITHVKYTAQDGNVTTMNVADYQSDLISEPARLMPSYAASTWPTPRENTFNAVEVQYVVGYGLTAAIPADIIEALYRIVGHWINNQSALESGTTITRVPFAVEQMLTPYIINSFGPA